MRSTIKILTFALAIMTGFGTLQVSAQETLTVHDRSDGNGFVPVYGNYANDCLKAEFVISGNELAP